MSDICKINVSMLKSYEKDFKTELNNFNNKTYTTFSSSYLKNCSDAYVRRMSNELQTLYDKVKKGYQNIDKWWVDYNTNVEGLENYLSDNGSAGAISESSIRNSVNQLPNLKKYNLKFAGIIPASMVGASYNTVFANNAVVSTVDPFSSLYSDYRVSEVNASEVVNNDNIVDQIDEAISTASASVVSWAKNIGSSIKDFFVSTGAKISSFGETVVSKASEVIEDVDNFFDETKAYIANKAESLWDKTTEWWNDTTQKVDNWFDEVGTNISNGAKSLWADVTDWWSDVEDWWNDDALPWIQNAASAVWDVVKSVGATVAVFVQSLVEGILQFAEAIIDFVALVGTGVASIVTGLYDGGQAIYGAITGNEWSSVTKQMWGGTMGFVSNQYVAGWFDLLYQNTGYGQWLAENAYGFDITRSIGSGIGYIAGVVILTIATFGAGSVVAAGGSVTASTAAAATTATQMAVTATAAGIGRGTQNAWADGADLLEGLTAGTLTGLWEGLQFYVGGKISGLKIFGADGILKSIGSSGIGTKLLNGLARVVLDGADGGVEGFVLPLITSIYKDGYYDENGNYIEFLDDQNIFERYNELFDDNGGWSTVWTQASIGSATSLLGEAFDLRKYFKDSQATSKINISEQELQVKIDRYNELLEIKNSKDYISYKDATKYGDPNAIKPITKPEFEGIEKEFMALEGELALIAGITSEADVDISKIMDEVETEKLFDYDGSQPTVDLFATEKIVPEAEATFDMFANTDPVKQQEITDLKLEIQKEASSLDVLDPNFSRNADLLMKKAKLQEELVMFAHSQGMTFKEYIESCGKITQLDEATQTIVNQQARHIFEVAENAEPKISQMMRSLEVNGARLEGFNYRFKSEGSIARKIATKLNGSASIDAIGYYASNINDSLRYTLILDEKNYVNQMYDSLHKLINEGYQVRSINNSWGDSIYQGMNTSLVSPDGMVFELQFHTDASFKTKEFLNHQLYEIYRSPLADISQIKAAREIMEINQQMYVKTIDGMVNLTQFDIIDNATYKNYFDYNDFVSHYDSQIASWKANLSEKQKNLFHNYISEGVQKPGNYAAVNGLERNTLIDTTNRTVTVQNTFTSTRPAPISFEQFEQTYLPIEYEGRMITTMEDFIDMQHECFNELNAATSQMKLDEDTILYRGINLNAIESMTDVNGNSIGITNGDSLETIFNKIRAAGGEYTDKGFMSASPVPVHITTSKDIVLKLKCKKGVSGVDLSAVGGFENEFLLTANQKFDVVGFGKEEICGVMKNVLYLVSK